MSTTPTRHVLAIAGSAAVFGVLWARWLDWPWWAQMLLQFALSFAGAAVYVHVRRFRAAREQERVNALLEQPMVLNEDGELSGVALLPGESLEIEGYTDENGLGYVLAAKIVRPDGTVRLESDWRARHAR